MSDHKTHCATCLCDPKGPKATFRRMSEELERLYDQLNLATITNSETSLNEAVSLLNKVKGHFNDHLYHRGCGDCDKSWHRIDTFLEGLK